MFSYQTELEKYVSRMEYVTSWKRLRDKRMYCDLQPTETKRITLLKCSWWKTNLSRHLSDVEKKHLAWRLMIPADKWSQFTATRTKNNTNRRFYATEDTLKLHLHHTKISWRLALTYFPQYVSNSFLSVQRNSICCNVVLTTHKFKLGLGHKTHTIYT